MEFLERGAEADAEAGDDQGEVVIAIGEEAEPPRPADDPEGVFEHGVEALDQVATLALFAAEKGDGLRVVAHADEAVAEGGFLLLLVEVETHEPLPEKHGDGGAGLTWRMA